MGHQKDFQGKGKAFEEKYSPIPNNSSHAGTTLPPSYHSFDGLWADRETRTGASIGREVHLRETEQGMNPRHHLSRNDELRIDHRARVDRRKHHRPRRSSSSHNSSWTAKLVFQGLRSNLFGSGNNEYSERESKSRSSGSRTTKLDISSTARDVHYTINNHWHEMSPSGHKSRTKTWPDYEQIRHGHSRCAEYMHGALPTFGFNAHPSAHSASEWERYQDHPALFEDFVPGSKPYMHEDVESKPIWEMLFGASSYHPSHAAPCSQPALNSWWSGHPRPEQAWGSHKTHEWGRHRPDLAAEADPTLSTASNGDSHRCREGESRSRNDHQGHPSRPPNSDLSTPDPASPLAGYNKRWDYIDTIQQPFAHELPWPQIRPSVSFDHMKCDVFSFFAHGFGLQPDRTKAPKLDFKLSPRSPYPSYDQRQQDRERGMLKGFKQQMQREKLRWHEDKLRRKFPEVVGVGSGRDNEERKAVWAAIAEGSAVCDRRLASML